MLRKLKKIVKSGEVLLNEPLKKHTSFKIGGNAKYLVIPKTCEEIIDLVGYLLKKKAKFFILGNGTNVLAGDNGYDGVIIKTTTLNEIRKYSGHIQVFAGTSLSALSMFACKNGLKGLEDAYGFPGTVGGAVVMNASSYNFEISKVVIGVLALYKGKVDYYNNQNCGFSYRKSIFTNDYVILSVDFFLKETSENLYDRMQEVFNLRKEKQPLNYPSAGSVFKRRDGVVVSALIDRLGLKGKSVGGAKVSEKHAGFIINYNNASAQDVINLIKLIKAEVKNKSDIALEQEIIMLN